MRPDSSSRALVRHRHATQLTYHDGAALEAAVRPPEQECHVGVGQPPRPVARRLEEVQQRLAALQRDAAAALIARRRALGTCGACGVTERGSRHELGHAGRHPAVMRGAGRGGAQIRRGRETPGDTRLSHVEYRHAIMDIGDDRSDGVTPRLAPLTPAKTTS